MGGLILFLSLIGISGIYLFNYISDQRPVIVLIKIAFILSTAIGATLVIVTTKLDADENGIAGENS
jgi:ribose/xylose/arabinose/galactoside ABC-type transport system permease subunit